MAKIIWLTGLSGAGKTTLSKEIKKTVKKRKILILDGDRFRKKTGQFSFSKKNILKNNLQIIDHCKKNYFKYDIILVSVISPLKKTRHLAFNIFKENYFEVYIHAKIKSLVTRDTKGLYNLAKKGLIKNLIGFKSKISYEKSNHKYIKINTDLLKIKKSVIKILKYSKI